MTTTRDRVEGDAGGPGEGEPKGLQIEATKPRLAAGTAVRRKTASLVPRVIAAVQPHGHGQPRARTEPPVAPAAADADAEQPVGGEDRHHDDAGSRPLTE